MIPLQASIKGPHINLKLQMIDFDHKIDGSEINYLSSTRKEDHYIVNTLIS